MKADGYIVLSRDSLEDILIAGSVTKSMKLIFYLRTLFSCQSRTPTEEGLRKESRTDNSPNRPVGAAGLLHRSGQHQPRDLAGDAAGWSSDEDHSRRNESRTG